MVNKSIKELEIAAQTGSEEEIFVVTKKANNHVQKFQDITHDAAKVSRAVVNFEGDRRLTDITSIGNVRVEKHRVSVVLAPAVTEVLHIQQSDNDKTVVWFDVLPGGQMICMTGDAINYTSQLSLFSGNKERLSQLDLPYTGASAAMLDDHQVIVALSNTKQVQIVKIVNDKLIKAPVIKIVAFPWSIQKYLDGFVFVLAVTEPSWFKRKVKRKQSGDLYFQFIDLLTGKAHRQIKLKTDLQTPDFMQMSRERDAVYIVDIDKGCYGFNLKGGVLFHYSHADYDDYAGLAVDRRGALYFSAWKHEDGELKCMIKLSPAGQLLRQLDIAAHPVQCIGNKLYVCGVNDQNDWVISYMFV